MAAAPTLTITNAATLAQASADSAFAVGSQILCENEIMAVSAKVTASYTTNLVGATNNDLVFTAVAGGVGGNAITITYVDPGGTTAVLGVVVAGNAITVNLGRAASAINSTAALVAAAIAASAPASALVSVANAGGNDGTGLVAALSVQSLAGGGMTVTRAQEATMAAQHTTNDVFLVERVDHQRSEGPEVYYLDPVSGTTLMLVLPTVPTIIQAVSAAAVTALVTGDVKPGQCICYYEPATNLFTYSSKDYDLNWKHGSTTLT